MKKKSGKPSEKALDNYMKLMARYSWRKCDETV